MNQGRSIILVELNELCPHLMDHYISLGYLPHFKTLFDQSQVFTTDAQEDFPYLEPWIQWVTVHTGLPYQQHKIFHLDEGHKFKEQWLWDLISDAGYFVWLCGSMNVGYKDNLNGLVVPDPWSSIVPPYPYNKFTDYLNFVKMNVQENSNKEMKNTFSELFKFIQFMFFNGLTTQTIFSTMKQLMLESMNPSISWRRTFILDALQFDLFKNIYKKHNPHFSTFFSNSVAHLQHLYWRYMEPEKFKISGINLKEKNLSSAILQGYQANDALIGNFFNLIDKNTVLIFCTALSQQPCLIYEEISGKQGYRAYSIEKLLNYIEIKYFKSFSSIMAEQFRIIFNSEQEAKEAQIQLESLKINNTKLMSVMREGNEIVCGCGYFGKIDKNEIIVNSKNESVQFDKLFYPLSDIKSGMHHRDGMLWIRTPEQKHHVHQEKVAITRITPTILKFLNIPKPKHMDANALELFPGTE